jgi:hypothetical protein
METRLRIVYRQPLTRGYQQTGTTRTKHVCTLSATRVSGGRMVHVPDTLASAYGTTRWNAASDSTVTRVTPDTSAIRTKHVSQFSQFGHV